MVVKKGCILFLLVACLLGCAVSKPNPSYQGPYPPGFKTVSAKNPLLAEEIGKLPELQDGMSENEKKALMQLVSLYEKDPDQFDDAFKAMYDIGLPAHRKYCTPLQALFWLAEKESLNDEAIVDYSLPKLLKAAWKEEKTALTDEKVLQVIEGINDKNMRNLFLNYVRNGVDQATMNTLYRNYQISPEIFSWSARKLIKEDLSSDPRWTDIDAVIDRLNSPMTNRAAGVLKLQLLTLQKPVC